MFMKKIKSLFWTLIFIVISTTSFSQTNVTFQTKHQLIYDGNYRINQLQTSWSLSDSSIKMETLNRKTGELTAVEYGGLKNFSNETSIAYRLDDEVTGQVKMYIVKDIFGEWIIKFYTYNSSKIDETI